VFPGPPVESDPPEPTIPVQAEAISVQSTTPSIFNLLMCTTGQSRQPLKAVHTKRFHSILRFQGKMLSRLSRMEPVSHLAAAACVGARAVTHRFLCEQPVGSAVPR
jgi:hypothetical protein